MQQFKELSSVILKRYVDDQGIFMPAGSRGVVVHVYEDDFYEVEFTTPKHAVLTIESDNLKDG